MFLSFFQNLRAEGVPATPGEFLVFLDGVKAGLAAFDAEGLYHLGRLSMVKDERLIDRYDRAFARTFGTLADLPPERILPALALPADWLDRLAEAVLSPEEQARVASAGSLEALMQALADRLAEQRARHEGGARWIGTAGTSPFGAWGWNPAGIRVGQDRGRSGRAAKVWEARSFRDYDEKADLGPRAMKLALRRLRRWARAGAAEELDLPGTVRATAERGWLELRSRPERRNARKVLLFLDVGGSMDAHVGAVEALFAAARAEFAHLECFRFHNCLYEKVWRDAARRPETAVALGDLLARHGPGWTCVVVGDATMGPWEITRSGGSVEHWNAEPGAVWLGRAAAAWPRHLWINPVPERFWDATPSIGLVRAAFGGRMVPLTLEGLNRGVALLRR